MKYTIFFILFFLILPFGIFAQNSQVGNKEIQELKSSISDDLTKWDDGQQETPSKSGVSDSYTAGILQPTYEHYVAVHREYLRCGTFSSLGQSYKTVIDSLVPALITESRGSDIRNPLDIYITLMAIYIYSEQISLNIPKRLKDQNKRAKEMKRYIEKRLIGYQSIFDDMIRNYITTSALITEEPYSNEYMAERDKLFVDFYNSKQLIDAKSVNLIDQFQEKREETPHLATE